MTTLVWDGKNRILATDSREVWDGHQIAKTQKLFKLDRKNCFLAAAGDSEQGQRAFLWINENINSKEKLFSGQPLDSKFKGFQGIIIYDAIPYTALSGLVLLPLCNRFFTLGTGGPYALASLHLGFNGIEAVKFASKFDCHTDEEVQHIQIPEPKQRNSTRK